MTRNEGRCRRRGLSRTSAPVTPLLRAGDAHRPRRPQQGAARSASRPSGRLSTATRRPRAIRSRAASAVRARSAARSARSSAAVGGRGLLEERTQQARRQVDDAGRLADQRQRRGDRLDALGLGRQLQLADATRARRRRRPAGGPRAAPRALARRRWRSATGAAPGPRPRSISSAARSGSEAAQASAAARPSSRRGADPVTRTTAGRRHAQRIARGRSLRPRHGGGGDGEPIGQCRQRRGRPQAHADAAALDRDVDVVRRPAGQRVAGGCPAPAVRRPAPAPPPRRRRRRAVSA